MSDQRWTLLLAAIAIAIDQMNLATERQDDTA